MANCVPARSFPKPKATRKTVNELYDTSLNEQGAASVKLAGLVFLNKLAQVMRSNHQGKGRKTLDPVMTSHVVDRVNRRVTRSSVNAGSTVLERLPAAKKGKKKQLKKRAKKRNSTGESEHSSDS